MLGMGYDAKNSMSIAYVFLMGGAFASMWKARDKKNPKTGGPLIDYNLVMLTLPSAVSGSLFGVDLCLLSVDDSESLHFQLGDYDIILDTVNLSCFKLLPKATSTQAHVKAIRGNSSVD